MRAAGTSLGSSELGAGRSSDKGAGPPRAMPAPRERQRDRRAHCSPSSEETLLGQGNTCGGKHPRSSGKRRPSRGTVESKASGGRARGTGTPNPGGGSSTTTGCSLGRTRRVIRAFARIPHLGPHGLQPSQGGCSSLLTPRGPLSGGTQEHAGLARGRTTWQTTRVLCESTVARSREGQLLVGCAPGSCTLQKSEGGTSSEEAGAGPSPPTLGSRNRGRRTSSRQPNASKDEDRSRARERVS